MWAWIFDAYQRDLAATLERGDEEALAAVMASMFQEDFVLGLASGPLITHANSRLASRIWCLKSYSYNQEVNADFLGEAQGVVHRAIAALGCFERLRRDESWVRRGYVEEVYVPGTQVKGGERSS